jgi:ElaB/YqjD/DUF883 family membrane-anchored ribosome-binding protein
MQSPREPSIEDLREESERARQDFTNTVEELRDKVGGTATELKTLVSPAHIKKEIKNYVREERESIVRSVQRRAKENPLQAAAVGATLAYPALGLLRAIPTPLLLIGAGLFFTSSRGRSSANQIKDKVNDAWQQGSEKVSDLAASIKSDLEDRIAGARYWAEEARDAVVSGVDAAASRVDAVTGKARAAYHDAADAVSSTVAGAADRATATAANLSATAANAATSAKDRATSIGANSLNTVTDFINQNPLLVAGIGAAVGACIAASIPPSEAENRMFGKGSDTLKDKAREATAQGIEKAGEFAADAVGGVAAAAAREGLDATGVRRTLNTVADSMRAVADRGLDTALGSTAAEPNQNYTTERNAS